MEQFVVVIRVVKMGQFRVVITLVKWGIFLNILPWINTNFMQWIKRSNFPG